MMYLKHAYITELGSLAQRRKHSRLSMMYKIRNNRVDINAAKFLQSGDARTRGQHRQFQERIKDQILSNEWNLLPVGTVSAPTSDAFGSLLVE